VLQDPVEKRKRKRSNLNYILSRRNASHGPKDVGSDKERNVHHQFLSHTLQWINKVPFHFHSISQSASPTVCPLGLGGAESACNAMHGCQALLGICLRTKIFCGGNISPFVLALRIHTVSSTRFVRARSFSHSDQQELVSVLQRLAEFWPTPLFL
jgi:hypothetical protein